MLCVGFWLSLLVPFNLDVGCRLVGGWILMFNPLYLSCFSSPRTCNPQIWMNQWKEKRDLCVFLLWQLILSLHFWVHAAELPLLLYVCIFFNTSLHVRVCNVSIVYQGSDGSIWEHCLEGNERITCISHINGLLLCLPLVCWWSNWLPFVSYWH